ncbi:MAG TPA: hypothetical protein VIJ40_00025 [Acidimicrobiales bacterium]
MVTLFDDLELGLTPYWFLATTEKVYDDPTLSPLTTQLLETVVHLRRSGCEVTT